MHPAKRKKLVAFSLLLAALPALPALVRAEQTSMLDTVVVTADRIESSLKEVAANVTVLSSGRIQSSTATNVGELLADEGFQVMNQGAQTLLSIRGMGQMSGGNEVQSRVLVLIDGRRIGANNVNLMDINKDAIDRIEIIRGPSAVQYGSSALGGVVNIITKRGQEGVQGAAEIGFGSFNLNKQALAVRGAGGGFDAALSVSQQGRNSYNVSGGDTWAHTELGSSVASNLDLGYTFLQNNRLGLNVNFYNQNHAESPDNGFFGSGPTGTAYNIYDQRNWNVALQYEGADAGKLFTWSARYAFGRDQSDYDPTHSSYGGAPSTTYLDNQSLTAQTTYNGDALSVNVGIDYLKYSLQNYGQDAGESTDNAGFFSARYRLFAEKLILSAGGRFDHYQVAKASGGNSDDNFAPSLGVVVAPKSWLKFRANYAEGFRMPAPNEYLGDNTWYVPILPNPDLRPEKSKTYEIGADIAVGIFTSSLTYFHTDWDDKIINQTMDNYQYQYINLNTATIAGLEWAANLEFRPEAVKGLMIRPRLSFTWLTTRQNGDAAQVALVGSDTLINTPEYSLSYGADFAYDPWALKVGITAVTSSDILTADWRADYMTGIYSPTYGQYIDAGSGTVVNISLDKRLYAFADQHGKISLRLEANNIFDGKNETYLDYPGPGRSFYAGLRYEF